MSPYFVEHKHFPESCPAMNPKMGNALLSHINPQNAREYRSTMQGDEVLDNKNSFILIMDTAGLSEVENFMPPFQGAGEVKIWNASSCEIVVQREGC